MKKHSLSQKTKTILRMILAVISPTIMSLLLVLAVSVAYKFIQLFNQSFGDSTAETVSLVTDFIDGHATLSSILVYLAVMPFVYKVCLKKVEHSSEKESRITRYVYLLPLGAAAACLCNFVMTVICTYFMTSESFVGESVYSGSIWIDLIIVALLPAVVEELIYRGTVYNGLKYFMNKWVAVFLSAAIFAIMHQSPAQALYAFMLGILFAVVYEHYGNLLASVLLHFGANVLSVLGSEWTPLKKIFSSEGGSICALAISGVVVLVPVIMLAVGRAKHRKKAAAS